MINANTPVESHLIQFNNQNALLFRRYIYYKSYKPVNGFPMGNDISTLSEIELHSLLSSLLSGYHRGHPILTGIDHVYDRYNVIDQRYTYSFPDSNTRITIDSNVIDYDQPKKSYMIVTHSNGTGVDSVTLTFRRSKLCLNKLLRLLTTGLSSQYGDLSSYELDMVTLLGCYYN